MSVDLYASVRVAAFLVALGILALGLYRAIQMGRDFVNRLYRARAFWTAAVALVVMIVLSVDSVVGNGLGLATAVPAILLFIVLFVFADRTVQVAIEMDFFHRNTLRWRQVRKLLYVVLLTDVVYFLVGLAGGVLSPLLFFGTVFVVFGLAIAAVAISALRTPDRTIKRHVGLFGILLVGFIAALYTGQPGVAPALNFASDLIVVAMAYTLFLMVMSLSPLGRVEKAAEGAPQLQ
jgi:hypothetical protein